jgi:hypothetical protein
MSKSKFKTRARREHVTQARQRSAVCAIVLVLVPCALSRAAHGRACVIGPGSIARGGSGIPASGFAGASDATWGPPHRLPAVTADGTQRRTCYTWQYKRKNCRDCVEKSAVMCRAPASAPSLRPADGGALGPQRYCSDRRQQNVIAGRLGSAARTPLHHGCGASVRWRSRRCSDGRKI